MEFYTEGLLWYIFLIDAMMYGIMSFTQGRRHTWEHHWLSGYFPLNRFFSFFYLFLVLWTGFTLYRMGLIVFW